MREISEEKHPSILVISADTEEAAILKAELELSGYRDSVMATCDPEEALGAMEEHDVGLIVYHNPSKHTECIDLLNTLRPNYDIPVLLIADPEEAGQMETNATLLIPYAFGDFLNLVQNFLPSPLKRPRDRMRDAADMKEEEHKYRDLFDRASDMILLMDLDTHTIIDANEQAEVGYGYSREELIGMSLLQIVPRDQHISIWKNTRELAEGTKTLHAIERVHTRKDGSPIKVSVSASLFEYGGRRIFQDIIRDETERIQRAEELRRHREQLEEMVQERTKELAERLEFERIISAVSTNLVNVNDSQLYEEIGKVCLKIGEFFSTDSATILLFSEDKKKLIVYYDWIADDLDYAPHVSGEVSGLYPWSMERLLNDEVVQFSQIDELPEEAIQDKETFIEDKAKSILVIPLRLGGGIIGAFALGAIRSERIWNEALVPRLRVLGEIIVNDIQRRRLEKEGKKAEQALRENEEKYRTVVENANEAIVVAQDDMVKFANPEAVRLIGYTEDEIYSRPFIEFIHPDDRKMIYVGYLQNLKGKGIGVVDFRLVSKDGSIRWAYPDSTAITWEGRPATLNFLTDITERKQIEQELRHTQMYYTDFIDSSSDNVSYWKVPDGLRIDLPIEKQIEMLYHSSCIDANRACWEVWGFETKDEAIGKEYIEIIQERTFGQLFADFIENGYSLNNYETYELFHHGREYYGLMNIYGVVENGFLIRLWEADKDITEQKKAEEQIRELSQIIVQMKDAVIVAKGDVIEYVNDAFCDMYGYTKDEIIGQRGSIFSARTQEEEEALREKFSTALRGGPSTIEYKDRRKDGSVFWVSNTIGFIYTEDPHERHWLSVIRDITERKQSEEELRKMEEDSRQLQQELTHVARVSAMGELVASIAHEINQPLAATLNNAQAAQRFLDLDKPDLDEVRDILTDIAEDSKRASDTIQRLRSLLQKGETHRDALDMSETVQEILNLMKAEFSSRDISVKLDLASKLPSIFGDRIQLQQVLMNLVLNSCDAMMDIAPGLRELGIRTSADNSGNIMVVVRDSGSGIDDEEMEHMFEAFYTTKSDGIGMGLSISRSIIEAHGGRLWAENKQAKGTTFYFAIPSSTESESL